MTNPAQEVTHDVTGKLCIVTGANTGIGAITARELARAGAQVILACRSQERTEGALHEIEQSVPGAKVEFMELDLASLDSVRRFAAEFLKRDLPLHILVNNAGLAGQRGLTKDGFELTFGVNHLGHFLLTELLLARLKESAPARIVNVSSGAHYMAKRIDFAALREPTKTVSAFPEYGVSKLCNVLFSRELAKRLGGTRVTTYSLHPGRVASDIWRRIPWPLDRFFKLFMISTEEGARTSLYCATAPELADETGLYYDECRVKKASRTALDDALAKKLWSVSEEWTRA